MARQSRLPDGGFAKLPNWYITSGTMARLDPCAWKVLCVLVARCMGKPSCWPSISGISADTGVSERHVVRCIADLEREGLVSGEKRPGANTVYTLVQDRTPDTMSPLTLCHPCHDVTPTTDTMSPLPLTPCHPNKTKAKKTSQEDRPSFVGSLIPEETDETTTHKTDSDAEQKPRRATTRRQQTPRVFVEPKEQECIDYGRSIGLSELVSMKFYATMVRDGWTTGKQQKPIVSWKGAMNTWKVNEKIYGQQAGAQQPTGAQPYNPKVWLTEEVDEVTGERWTA